MLTRVFVVIALLACNSNATPLRPREIPCLGAYPPTFQFVTHGY